MTGEIAVFAEEHKNRTVTSGIVRYKGPAYTHSLFTGKTYECIRITPNNMLEIKDENILGWGYDWDSWGRRYSPVYPSPGRTRCEYEEMYDKPRWEITHDPSGLLAVAFNTKKTDNNIRGKVRYIGESSNGFPHYEHGHIFEYKGDVTASLRIMDEVCLADNINEGRIYTIENPSCSGSGLKIVSDREDCKYKDPEYRGGWWEIDADPYDELQELFTKLGIS